jgi:ankyrin repeat protein
MHPTIALRVNGRRTTTVFSILAAVLLSTLGLFWARWIRHQGSLLPASALSEMESALPAPSKSGSVSDHDAFKGGGARRAYSSPGPFMPQLDVGRKAAAGDIEAAGATLTSDGFVQAVAHRDEALVQLFLKAGIDVDGRNTQGQSALSAAVAVADRSMTDRLLAVGANVNSADSTGLTPLMIVAARDSTQLMQLLIENGASIDARDPNGHSPLYYAISTRSIGAMQLLLDRGTPASGKGASELYQLACETGDWRIIEPILERQPNRLEWNVYTRRLVYDAGQARDARKLQLLLSKHATQPTPEGRAQPLLAYALIENNLPFFKFMLDCGADPNTPLNSPTEKVFYQTVTHPELRDYLASEGGLNVLMLAAGLGRTEFVRALLEHGAKRGISSAKSHFPPVLFAAMTQSAPAMQALIPGAPSPEKLRIEISLASQEASVIRNGAIVKTTEISTGKSGYDTKPGEYVITDKNTLHRSTIYKCDMPFFMRLNGRDFGMHAGVVPGYPASHGCIRLPAETARELFKEIPLGTLVSVR